MDMDETRDPIQRLREELSRKPLFSERNGYAPLDRDPLLAILDEIEAAYVPREEHDERIEELEAELDAELQESAFWEAEHDVEMKKRIDLELTLADMDRTHMRLPVDADGVPIRPGDEMRFGADAPVRVDSIGTSRCYCGDFGWFGSNGGFYGRGTLRSCRHVKPETVESLLNKFQDDVLSAQGEYAGEVIEADCYLRELHTLIEDYAERIRKAVEHGNG